MSGKAPERIWAEPGEATQGMFYTFDPADHDTSLDDFSPYVLAAEADEWKRKLDIMKKALIEIEMFQGPAAYGRLPGMARKALDECGVKK